jgi:hypothetical protein
MERMTRRALMGAVGGVLLGLASGALAAEEDQKRIVNGPSKTSFGGFELVLGQGASAETAFQPDSSTLVVKTLVGEARIVTSAKNLIMVENSQGRVEILLPNGRLVVVEPGRAEIVGRTLGDDPGNITIRLSGTGPIAQVGGPTDVVQTHASFFLLSSGVPSILDNLQTQGSDSGRGPTPLSATQ